MNSASLAVRAARLGYPLERFRFSSPDVVVSAFPTHADRRKSKAQLNTYDFCQCSSAIRFESNAALWHGNQALMTSRIRDVRLHRMASPQTHDMMLVTMAGHLDPLAVPLALRQFPVIRFGTELEYGQLYEDTLTVTAVRMPITPILREGRLASLPSPVSFTDQNPAGLYPKAQARKRHGHSLASTSTWPHNYRMAVLSAHAGSCV
jgi:hypothetical protein